MFYIEVLGVNVYPFAILLASIVNIIIGFVWYSPFVFGNMWMKELNKKTEDLKMKPIDLVFSIGSALFASIGLNSILQFAESVSGLTGVLNALISTGMITFSILAPSMIYEVSWEGKTIKLFLINFFHRFAIYFAMSLILLIWIEN